MNTSKFFLFFIVFIITQRTCRAYLCVTCTNNGVSCGVACDNQYYGTCDKNKEQCKTDCWGRYDTANCYRECDAPWRKCKEPFYTKNQDCRALCESARLFCLSCNCEGPE